MRKLTRYMLGQLSFTVLTIALVLTCIIWLVQTLRYVDFIANKNVPFLLFFKMIMYLLPNIFVITVPISLLIGIIFIYNKFIADHELVVMQAAGVGHWQLAKPAVLLSLFFTIFLYFFTIYFLPFSSRKHRDILMDLRQESLASLVSVGQFNTFEKYTIYVRQQDPQGNYLGILVYNLSPDNKVTTFMAEKGILFNKEEGGRLLLINGTRQEKDLATGKPSILYFDRYAIEAKEKSPEEPKERFLKAHERSIKDLFTPNDNKSLPPSTRLEFLSAAHQRLISPLYGLAFGLIGVCCMILGHFNRKGRTGKIVLACGIATFIEVGTLILLYTLTYSTVMIVLSYGLIIGSVVICLFLLSPLIDNLVNAVYLWRRQ